MKLQDQVCSFELAKKLKELGVKQGSLFYWYTDGLNFQVDIKTDYIRGVYGYSGKQDEMYPTFTVAELGEMLPNFCSSYQMPEPHTSSSISLWYCGAKETELSQVAETEADARAKMLIYLIENNLMEAK